MSGLEVNWGLVLLGLALLFLLLAFKLTKIQQAGLRELVLIAIFVALAAGGRILFAGIPNVQPTTFLVIMIGLVFGPRTGFITGTLAALVSNFFLGQGLWTPWQMLAWGLGGCVAGLIGRRVDGYPVVLMTVFSFAWGFIFDWLMNIWMWLSFYYPLSLESLGVVMGSGLFFDILHSIGNAVLALVAGPYLYRFLRNIRQERWQDASRFSVGSKH